MKIPKIFIAKKTLKKETKKLLEKPEIPQFKDEKRKKVFEEAKEQFPNLIDYLSSIYPNLEVVTDVCVDEPYWSFWNKHWSFWDKDLGMIGRIGTYHRSCGKDLTEYGYNGEVCVNKKWIYLAYRKGYICPNNSNDVILTHNPHRYDDKEYNIPFP